MLTGEAVASEEDDAPVLAPSVAAPMAIAQGPLTGARPPSSTVPGTTFATRGPTIKPWLTRKLAETMAHTDSSYVAVVERKELRELMCLRAFRRRGRAYADNFKTLPDKKDWAEYYRIITHPMSFDVVAVRPGFINRLQCG